ncbi:MAG: 4-hydroxy-3-methylbut-2-enyl diphosphate reductase [Bacteroidales bacterium]|nr:4-hydroxy-3-methylbut-2-enyl diphosphate reductase [Candidatus Equimonas enterica]
MRVEIDMASGFCFGVTTAIRKAEEQLAESGHFYCLGDIVHNSRECERLNRMGLEMIDHATFRQLHGVKVLLRAHGEPPEIYHTAQQNGVTLVDATCPVVLRLQQRIKQVYQQPRQEGEPPPQIVIYGKPGHAEVLGLVGQTEGNAIVIAEEAEAAKLDFSRDIYLFSQTTKPLEGFRRIVDFITARIVSPARFYYFDTICRNVSGRLPGIQQFAATHDVVIFVCGLKSSNGRVLYEACRSVNARSFLVEAPDALRPEWLEGAESVGICGATSTPLWLMEQCAERVKEMRG